MRSTHHKFKALIGLVFGLWVISDNTDEEEEVWVKKQRNLVILSTIQYFLK